MLLFSVKQVFGSEELFNFSAGIFPATIQGTWESSGIFQ
jgi:hypothetical protein